MSSHADLGPRLGKVLVITGCWTALLALTYVSTYLLIGDLIAFGKLSGNYAFWPDFAGNFIVGVLGGLVGGSLLVFKVNPGYRHETFLSGIVHSVVLFLTVYVSFTVFIVFAMPFVLHLIRGGTGSALVSGWNNVVANVYTPSFLLSTAIFGLLVSGTQFMLQVNDKFGPGVLWKLLTGKYYHPRDEERVFLFLDLRSSTEIAESIGHKRFFELLRELFQDVTKPIVDSRGDIYQYVGDEVIVSWPSQRAFQEGNCIECFFRIERAIAARSAVYRERFGLVPGVKAGIHVGEATVGEIGVVKKDIVFSGDVLNTTSRIQQECNRYDVNLLASSELLRRMPLGPAYVSVPVGEILLRGKAEALSLNAIQASTAVHAVA
jgi:adenylate cyclase